MYIKVGGYTYSCYEPVQVGDKVLLPAPPWGGRPDMSTVSAVDVGYPPDYDGPIKEVLKVFPQLQPAEITKIVLGWSEDERTSFVHTLANQMGFNLHKKPKRKCG